MQLISRADFNRHDLILRGAQHYLRQFDWVPNGKFWDPDKMTLSIIGAIGLALGMKVEGMMDSTLLQPVVNFFCDIRMAELKDIAKLHYISVPKYEMQVLKTKEEAIEVLEKLHAANRTRYEWSLQDNAVG